MPRYGIRNAYRPSYLVPRAYGWTSAPGYRSADVPTQGMTAPSNLTAEQFRQQFAYEWFNYGDRGPGFSGQSNPPFVSGAAGRLHPMLLNEQGGPARILRGFIRRANYETGDDMSRTRLYFMYNPETITRDYVSYLDQGALDPFNTVFQSKNEIAPPSFMDFTFELFFDRQEEAADPGHPGVFVDYQFFDMVVRNVVPSDADMSSNTLPDNGVMMVNPRDITVVFSPQITVQGRPLNPRVSFERFTHRMTPTRMRIALTMRVVYMGPMRAMQEYVAEQFAAEQTIHLDEVKESAYTWTFEKLEYLGTYKGVGGTEGTLAPGFGGSVPGVPGAVVPPGQVADYIAQAKLSGDANKAARARALEWALGQAGKGYSKDERFGPNNFDCSGLVGTAYEAIGARDAMHWPAGVDTQGMAEAINNNPSTGQKITISSAMTSGVLQPGDLMCRFQPGHGHVNFFMAYDGDGIQIMGAQSPDLGTNIYTNSKGTYDDYSYAMRPTPYGQQMAANVPTGGP